MNDPIVQRIVEKLYPPSEDPPPVYVEVDNTHYRYCITHESVWDTRWSECPDAREIGGRCVPVPLYIEARDP